MKQKFIFKYILLFLLFIFLHYIEGLPPIFGLSVAQFWKLPLLFFLVCYNLYYVKKRILFEKSAILLFFEIILSRETWIYPLKNIIYATKQLPLVLFFGFLKTKFKNKSSRFFEIIVISFAQFISLTSLLVLLGVITPLYKAMSAASFGVDMTFYSAIFGDIHAASSYFSASIFVYIWAFSNKKFTTKVQKIFNAFLLGVSLVSLFMTYVRTGWLMCLIGVLCFFRVERITNKQFVTGVLALFLIFGGLVYFYNTNEAFNARISGRNIYNNKNATGVDLGGSGRIDFWKSGVEVWWNGSVYEFFCGVGLDKVVAHNAEKVGRGVFSHNQFVDTLARNGILGLLLLLFFYYGLYIYIRKRKCKVQNLAYATWIGSVIFAFFQSEIYFDYAFIFALILVLLDKSYKEQRQLMYQ